MSRELPISLSNARKAANWLMTNFGGSIRTVSDGTPFDPALICSIACQETVVPDDHRSGEPRAVRAVKNILDRGERRLRHRTFNRDRRYQRQSSPTQHPTRLPSDSVSK